MTPSKPQSQQTLPVPPIQHHQLHVLHQQPPQQRQAQAGVQPLVAQDPPSLHQEQHQQQQHQQQQHYPVQQKQQQQQQQQQHRPAQAHTSTRPAVHVRAQPSAQVPVRKWGGGSTARTVALAKPLSPPPTDPKARKQKELEKKEHLMRVALREKQHTLRAEATRLAAIDAALSSVQQTHQQDINQLRQQLEAVEKEMVVLNKDVQRKEQAYMDAKMVLEQRQASKNEITSRLTGLILASEKLREDKLAELTQELDAVVIESS
ncbi:unnamed protein product [Chrysoparadoxa australica]